MSIRQQISPTPTHKSHRNYQKLFETIDHSYSTSSYRTKRNPEVGNRQHLKSKRLESQINNKDRKNPFFSLDNTSVRTIEQPKMHRIKTNSYLKLPIIQGKRNPDERVSPYDKLNPRQAYLLPTANSILRQKQLKQTVDSKSICSVNCLRNHQKQRKLFKIHSKSRKNDDVSQVRKYLSLQAEAKYPSTQLNRYLVKMKQMQPEAKPKNFYQTFFGIQPDFYRLETEYSKQLSHALSDPAFSEDKVQIQVPAIPPQQNLPQFLHSYQPCNKQIDMQKLLKSPRFLVEYSRIQLFFGEMVGNSKEGMGILIENGKVFQGIFRNNLKVKGMEINSSGIYNGHFYNQKRSGEGQFEWMNREYYIGEWKEGNRHGTGVWTNRYGDSYNGEWKLGKGQGYGVYIVGGQEYRGHFVDFKKEGWGKETFINGDRFQGLFRQGLPQGQGRYTWQNGTKYEGEFVTGLRNGKGILKTPDGFLYKGQFLDEKPEGLCQIFMPNGDTYHGYLRDGKKNGRGTLFLRDAQKNLDGFWQDDNFLYAIDN